MAKKILIVEDEADILQLVRLYLEKEGYRTCTASTGLEGLRQAKSEHPDLVILDLMLAEMDGLEVCKRIRADPKTAMIPIIMLTAKAEESDTIIGLELGADDYVTKPFSPKALVARVKALFRRLERAQEEPTRFVYGKLVVDLTRHEVLADGREVLRVGDGLVVDIAAHTVMAQDRLIKDLPANLFQLLCEFARHPGEVLSRDYLLMKIWHGSVRPHNVVTAVNRLKKRVGKPLEDWLVAVPGDGYRLMPVVGDRRPQRAEPPASSENA